MARDQRRGASRDLTVVGPILGQLFHAAAAPGALLLSVEGLGGGQGRAVAGCCERGAAVCMPSTAGFFGDGGFKLGALILMELCPLQTSLLRSQHASLSPDRRWEFCLCSACAVPKHSSAITSVFWCSHAEDFLLHHPVILVF